MSSPKGVIAFAPGRWGWPDFAGSPRYHLWSLAGRGRPVLYVEPPHRWRLRPRLWSAPDGRPFHVLSPARVLPFRFGGVPSLRIGNAWRGATSRALVRSANEAALHLKLDAGAWWLGAPWHSSIARLRPAGVPALYHVYDELSESPIYHEGQKSILRAWERELEGDASIVLCSSVPQTEARSERAQRAELLGNAISRSFIEQCSAKPKPSRLLRRLRGMARPRMGYAGVADLRLDPQLFYSLLAGTEEASLAILGPMDPRADRELARFLLAHPRAEVFGSVPHSEYPALMGACDVLILAHRRMPFTDAMYSEKLNEYLASGRPIVSIDLPEAVRLSKEATHPDAIRIARNAEEFLAAVRAAIKEEDDAARDARRALAATRTWEVEAEKLDRWIAELLGE